MSDLEKYIEKRKSQNKDFAENFDNKEIRDEYLAQVLKDGDKDEISEALKNIAKSKTWNKK